MKTAMHHQPPAAFHAHAFSKTDLRKLLVKAIPVEIVFDLFQQLSKRQR